MYRVDDVLESWIDVDYFQSLRFTQRLEERGRTRARTFDWSGADCGPLSGSYERSGGRTEREIRAADPDARIFAREIETLVVR